MPKLPSGRILKLSFRAQREICFLLVLGTLGCPVIHAQAQRPKILGICSVQISVTDYCKSIDFYSKVLGQTRDKQTECPPPGQSVTHYGFGFTLRSNQQLNLGSFATPDPGKLVSEFGFVTDDAPALLLYLKSQGFEAQPAGKFAMIMVIAKDPEGHRIVFMDQRALPREHNSPVSTSKPQRIIHVGFIVWNQTAMEHFYMDILGFHVYWHGGMKDDQTDWVDMQVPDGTDWIEFMLNVPPDADEHTLGVMNHIALGVPDVRAAANQLEKAGVKLPEPPTVGRDGKWQLNLYDPDGTRVELMEFTPVQKPCCSEYTGPHPKP